MIKKLVLISAALLYSYTPIAAIAYDHSNFWLIDKFYKRLEG